MRATRPNPSAPLPLGKLLILAVALTSAGAGVVHLGVAGQHLEHPFLVASFLAIGLTQVALAGALAMRPSRRILAGIAVAHLGILGVWATTRLTAVPLVPGLEEAQPVGLADLVVLVLETGAIAAAGIALLLPRAAARSQVAGGRRALVAVGSVVLALAVPGLIAPHSHPGGHGHGSEASPVAQHGHDASAALDGRGHDPLTHEQAYDALMGHGNDSSASGHTEAGHDALEALAGGGHAHEVGEAVNAPHEHASAGAGTRPDREVLELGEGHLAYEPATKDGTHSSAFRWHDGKPANHHTYQGDCTPTASQQAVADRMAADMGRALSKYHNNPWQALRDGFVAYPIPLSKMFHMVAVGRYYDGHMLDAFRVESFMYSMTDDGLTAVGGMFIFPNKERTPPNPTGCLLVWHRHTGNEGLVTSFDPQNPDQSVWMAHVWTYGGLDPWGRDFDGTEPHAWFFAYRYLPAICAEDGDCI